MRKRLCPQCDIHRFHIKNQSGEFMIVTVTKDYEIVPVNEGDSLEGYNLAILYCLGCSWKGSVKSLKYH